MNRSAISPAIQDPDCQRLGLFLRRPLSLLGGFELAFLGFRLFFRHANQPTQKTGKCGRTGIHRGLLYFFGHKIKCLFSERDSLPPKGFKFFGVAGPKCTFQKRYQLLVILENI